MVELKVYSQAFFEVALERQKIQEYKDEAKSILKTLYENNDLQKILIHPEVAQSKKFDILKDIFGDKVSGDFLGMFNIVLTKRREIGLKSILEGFLDLVREFNNAVVVKIFTPISLNSEQQQKIVTKLSSSLKRQVKLQINIEPKLVAGFKIVADGAILDASVSKQMANIRNSMYREFL